MKAYLFDTRDGNADEQSRRKDGRIGGTKLQLFWDVLSTVPECDVSDDPRGDAFKDRLQKSTHVIGHFGTIVGELIEGKLPENECDQIVLCVTTGAWGPDSGSGRHIKRKSRTASRYILFDHSHGEMSQTQIREFFLLTTEKAESVLVGDETKLSRALRSIFFPASLEFVPALGILCQGYLAVHAASDDAGSDVQDALAKMGWNDFTRGKGRGNGFIPFDLSRKIGEVRDHVWWISVLGNDPDAVRKAIERELRVNDLIRYPDIATLIESIYDEHSAPVDAEVVARAYCALASELGGHPCPSA